MFALALLASVASANHYGGYGHGLPQIPQVPHYGQQSYGYAPAQSYGYQSHQPAAAPAEHDSNPWGPVA